jgi:hypothetical protein
MTIVEITGGMLRAARSLTGLSQQELADRASISRPCLTAWEGSSGSVPNAGVRALHRVVSVLEAEGVIFTSGGVRLQRPAPMAGTVMHAPAPVHAAGVAGEKRCGNSCQTLTKASIQLIPYDARARRPAPTSAFSV